jgi:Leucine-rich repeat (LRR) protein
MFQNLWNLKDLSLIQYETDKKYSKELNSLKELHVYENPVVLIPTGEWSDDLSKLRKTDALDKSVFQDFDHWLKKLVIRNFNLSTILDNTFSKLSGLEILDLSANKIVFVNQTSFEGLLCLKELNLSGNEISSLLPEHMDLFFLFTEQEFMS